MGLLDYAGAGLAEGFGKGMVMAGTVGIEDRREEVKTKREENLARFKQGLDKDTASFTVGLKDEYTQKEEGRKPYAVSTDGKAVITLDQYNALSPEEKGQYQDLSSWKIASEERKQNRLEAKDDKQFSIAQQNANSTAAIAGAAVTRADKYVPGGGEKPMTEAQKKAELFRLRKEGKDIISRAGMGEDISADADWYNSEAAKMGLPEIRQNTKTVPGKKGLIWDDPAKQETSWGFSPSFAPTEPKGKAPAEPEITKATPTPKTKSEFDALAPGSIYISPDDGKRYQKPAAKTQTR